MLNYISNIQPTMDLQIILFDPQQSCYFGNTGKFRTEKLYDPSSI